MSGRYVVDENGERVAVPLDVEKYEQLVAQHHAPVEHDESISDDPLDDEEDFDPRRASDASQSS